MIKTHEDVQIVGAFTNNLSTLHVEVDLSFTIDPATFSPGMKMIVEKELHNAVTRMIEKAMKKR